MKTNQNDEQIPIEFDKLSQIFYSTSDSYIRHFESDIRYIEEKSKLTLWIIGLSIGMEIFVLNKIDRDSFTSTPIIITSILSGLFFVINCFYGLLLRIKLMRLISHHLQVITFYDHQKLHFEINFQKGSQFSHLIINDFSEGIVIQKICDLDYIKKKEEKNTPISLDDSSFIHKSDNHPFTLLVFQAITTIVLLVLIIFK